MGYWLLWRSQPNLRHVRRVYWQPGVRPRPRLEVFGHRLGLCHALGWLESEKSFTFLRIFRVVRMKIKEFPRGKRRILIIISLFITSFRPEAPRRKSCHRIRALASFFKYQKKKKIIKIIIGTFWREMPNLWNTNNKLCHKRKLFD